MGWLRLHRSSLKWISDLASRLESLKAVIWDEYVDKLSYTTGRLWLDFSWFLPLCSHYCQFWFRTHWRALCPQQPPGTLFWKVFNSRSLCQDIVLLNNSYSFQPQGFPSLSPCPAQVWARFSSVSRTSICSVFCLLVSTPLTLVWVPSRAPRLPHLCL